MNEETKLILEKLEKMDKQISDIQLTLENEINGNIRIVAVDLRQVNERIAEIARRAISFPD